MKTHFVRSLVVSALACFGVSAGAQSFSRAVPAEACAIAFGQTGRFFDGGAYAAASEARSYLCPFVDERDNVYGLEHDEVARVNVHVRVNHTSGASGTLCIRNYWNYYVECGTGVSATSIGDHTLALTSTAHLAPWTSTLNTTDFAWVQVWLGRENQFRGFWASQN